MKKILILILLITSFICEAQTYITKDTTFSGYPSRISYISGYTDSTNLILIMHGLGEVGASPNNSQVYGPHYWMNNGFSGAVVLGNGTHYPVYVTIQQPAGYTRPWVIKPIIDIIKNRFKVRYGGLHCMGVSAGGWAWQQVSTYKPTAGDESYYQVIRSIVNIQGVTATDTYDATLGWPQKFGNAAKASQLRYVGFEQVLDNRNIDNVVQNINDSIAGRGFMYWTNFGSSGHSNFNDFYDPSQTNWTLTNPDVQSSGGGVINTIPFAGGQNIYQWALRQSADTSLYSFGPTTETRYYVLRSGGGANRIGKFSFTLNSSASTSAGVYKNDSILVKTLWNNVPYLAGTYNAYWDGTDDYGNAISSPLTTYKIKILSNNVQYTWQGTIGNTSDNMTGATKLKGYFNCMNGLVFEGNFGYYCTGYSEKTPSFFKFNIATPGQKIDIRPHTESVSDVNYVATDSIKVYWGAFDANANTNTYVFGTNVSNDAYVTFSSGVSYTPLFRSAINTISKVTASNSYISGLAVQKTGIYLFVARAGLNELRVLNKTTGDSVTTLTHTNVRGICVDMSDNLWMITGTNTVAKYTVNGDGTLTAATLTLSGLLEPKAIGVSRDGTLVSVADASTSQQVKFFNNTTGAATTTLGVAGGYYSDPTVTDTKFYFKDSLNAVMPAVQTIIPFITYSEDGTFWVNDHGNFRVQHYDASNNFLNRIMSLGSNYSVYVDKNNKNRVFSDFIEFEVDYSQPITSSWTLKRNWGARQASTYDPFYRFRYPTTLSNGRTYGLTRKGSNLEVIEYTPSGPLRYGNTLTGTTWILCSDGSLQDYSTSGITATYKRYPLTGFDGSNNPIWSATIDTLAVAQTDNTVGNPIVNPISQIFSTTNKIALFNYKSYANNTGSVYSSGYHLGLMQKKANNTYIFQTEKSTHTSYGGMYPNAGWFDVGNTVNDFGGGNVNILGRNIITSYHGEFWKQAQTNKYNHYYDNGLAIGQFGTTRFDVGGYGNPASPFMAGNVISPSAVAAGTDSILIWHGDESDHAGLHLITITGLNTISEQVTTLLFPSQYLTPPTQYTDLIGALPFNATLVNNTASWTRNPTTDVTVNAFTNHFYVKTSVLKYEGLPDINVRFASPTALTDSVSRALGNNTVVTNWKLEGNVNFGAMLNGNANNAYLEVLDNTGKILTQFFAVNAGVLVKGNTVTVTNAVANSSLLVPFNINIIAGVVSFSYNNSTPVTTTISDGTADWTRPTTLRLKFVSQSGSNNNIVFDISDLRFYTDY